MQRTLKEHLEWLELKVARLTAEQFDTELTAEQRHQAAIDLELAVKALGHFTKAFELEQKLSKI